MAKRKAIMMLGVALLISFLVTLLAYNWLQEKATVLKSMQTAEAAVAVSDLKWATVLTRDMVKMVPYLKTSLPNGYFAAPAHLEGRTLLYPVKAGEPIFESKLAPVSAQAGGVAAIITPKKRAMAVKVDKVVGVSGFVNPGHRVDVLVSLAQAGKVEKPITKTVIENVLVLATGTEMEKTGSKDKPTQVDVITLEVTPEEGEKLALAATEGKLQLALRNSADTEDVLTRGTTIPTLLAAYSGGSPKGDKPEGRRTTQKMKRSQPQGAAAFKPETFTVELIQGGKASSLTFQKGDEDR